MPQRLMLCVVVVEEVVEVEANGKDGGRGTNSCVLKRYLTILEFEIQKDT